MMEIMVKTVCIGSVLLVDNLPHMLSTLCWHNYQHKAKTIKDKWQITIYALYIEHCVVLKSGKRACSAGMSASQVIISAKVVNIVHKCKLIAVF